MKVIKGTLKIGVAGLVLAIELALAVAGDAGTAAAPTNGKQLLNDLIAKAKQEGELNIAWNSEMAGVARQIEQAFLKRFRLNIRINADTAGEESASWSKMQVAVRSGAQPEFDVYKGNTVRSMLAKSEKLLKLIDNWELLLAEVNPLVGLGKVKPDQISWGALKGYSFTWHNYVYGIVYNTKLISKNELPQRFVDIPDPKHRERYAVAGFPTMWQYGTLIYPKDKWLKVVEEIGKNAAAVLTFAAGTERVALGEFAFQPMATQFYYRMKSRDPRAPVAIHWPLDFVMEEAVVHAVPAQSRHPAGGALWALWMTTAEAQKLWQPEIYYPNIRYGESALDLEVRNALKSVGEKGGKVVSWFDSPEAEAMLEWHGTKEGSDYRSRINKALTQRK